MADVKEVEILIKDSIRLLAEDFDLEGLRQADSKTTLFGSKGVLDSMALVNLLADIENAVHSRYGVPITLADERAMSAHNSPFLNIGTLTQAVIERLQQ